MASRTPRSDVLAAWLAGRRWYAAKARRLEALEVVDAVPLAGAQVLVVLVRFEGGADRYCVPVLPAPADQVVDALDEPRFCAALLDLARGGGTVRGRHGTLVGLPAAPAPAAASDRPVRRLAGEQSNTSVTFGDAFILKLFRRLPPGINPEEEMTRFLSERARFPHAPALHGHVEYRDGEGPPATLAVVQSLIPGARDGWEWVLAGLARVLDGADGAGTLDALGRLGEVTGALHVALASDPDDPAFAPEPIDEADVERWAAAVLAQLADARAALGAQAGAPLDIPADLGGGLRGLIGRTRIRHHGDFHLGQTLVRPETLAWTIIDFEGEPLRPLEVRRLKHAAARDVAGLLRSLAYAAAAAVRAHGGGDPAREARAAAWEARARTVFVDGYRRLTAGASFLPADDAAFARAVAVFELEKAAYEVVYEANNRPDWIDIPRRGLISAASRLRPAPSGAA